MNAAAAIVAGDKATSLKEAAETALEAIDSGAAFKKLEEIKKASNSL
jgi:anthranilate phosphoribosyltransferase